MFTLNRITITGAIRGFKPPPANPFWVAVTNQSTYSSRGIAVDDENGIYTVAAGSAPELIKLSPTGELEWQKTFSGTTPFFRSVSIFGNNIYAVGGNGTTVKKQIFNLTKTGTLTWAKQLTGLSQQESVQGSCVDNAGNLYTYGNYAGFPTTGQDGAIVKTNSAGQQAWRKRLSPASASSTETIYSAVCVGTDVYVAESTFLSGAFGTVLTKIAGAAGTIVWQRKLETNSDCSLATDGTDIYFASAYNNKPWLVKVNSSGVIQWQKNLNCAGGYTSISVDSDGGIYAATTTSTGGNDIIMVKYDNAGNVLWQGRAATSLNDTNPYINVTDSFLAMSFTSGSVLAVAKIPKDGSLVGTYGPVTFSSTSFTNDNTTTGTTTPTYVLNDINLFISDAVVTLTDSALTITRTDLP